MSREVKASSFGDFNDKKESSTIIASEFRPEQSICGFFVEKRDVKGESPYCYLYLIEAENDGPKTTTTDDKVITIRCPQRLLQQLNYATTTTKKDGTDKKAYLQPGMLCRITLGKDKTVFSPRKKKEIIVNDWEVSLLFEKYDLDLPIIKEWTK